MVKPKSLTLAWISSAFSDPQLLGVVPEGTKAEDVEHDEGDKVEVGSIADFIEECIYRHKNEYEHKFSDYDY